VILARALVEEKPDRMAQARRLLNAATAARSAGVEPEPAADAAREKKAKLGARSPAAARARGRLGRCLARRSRYCRAAPGAAR